MAWSVIDSTEVDALSPISDDLMGKIDGNLDYLKSVVTDAGSSPQGISTTTLTAATLVNVGTDLDVGGDSQFDGNVTIDGTLSVGQLFSSEIYFSMMAW